MILGTERIAAALADGAIVCDPAPTMIEGAHIDVRLGEHYWMWHTRDVLDLNDADPLDVFKPCKVSFYIVIPADGFILAHTQEFIGTAPGSGLLPMLNTRSTLARWGLSVHAGAGVGDEGYSSRWTLEIINTRPVAIALPVGARVGCIAFHRIEGAATPYQPGTRYNATRATWTPADMLPKRGNW